MPCGALFSIKDINVLQCNVSVDARAHFLSAFQDKSGDMSAKSQNFGKTQ